MAETRTVSHLRAYPVEITAVQTRESEADPWGAIRFEMRFAGEVQVSLEQEAARLYARFVTDVFANLGDPEAPAAPSVEIAERGQAVGGDSIDEYRRYRDAQMTDMASPTVARTIARDTARFARPAEDGRAEVIAPPDEDRPITLIRTAIRERREGTD